MHARSLVTEAVEDRRRQADLTLESRQLGRVLGRRQHDDLLRAEGERSVLRTALGSDVKGKISPLLYCLGIGLAFVNRWLGLAVYVAVALIWLVPDRRVERHLTTGSAKPIEQARRE